MPGSVTTAWRRSAAGGHSRWRVTQAREQGMVTAELASALPVVVILMALTLAVCAAGIDQIRCLDAATAAARAAARGDSPSLVAAVARRGAPVGAVISVTGESEITVTVVAPLRGLSGWLSSSLSVRASATANREEPGRW